MLVKNKMSTRTVEYGKIDGTDEYHSTSNSSNINCYISGLFVYAGVVALYKGSVLGATMLWGMIPFLWTLGFFRRAQEGEEYHNDDANIMSFAEKVVCLAQRHAKLPQPTFKRYRPENYSKETFDQLLSYLNSKLRQTGYLSAIEELAKLDTRLQLVIVNKDLPTENPDESKIVIPVNVRDNAWLGYPTENTCIINVRREFAKNIS